MVHIRESSLGDLFFADAGQIVAASLKVADKESRGAGLEPVHAESVSFECVEQAERIIDTCSAFAEMITVVHRLEFGVAFLPAHPAGFGQLRHAPVKIFFQFLLRHAADVRKTKIHRDVVEVVESAEDAHLPEFGDSREEGETDELILSLDDAVEALELAAERFHQFRGIDVVHYRLVVLIDEDHHLAPCLAVRRVDDGLEPGCRLSEFIVLTVRPFPSRQVKGQIFPQIIHRSVPAPRQIQMQHRILEPVRLQIL